MQESDSDIAVFSALSIAIAFSVVAALLAASVALLPMLLGGEQVAPKQAQEATYTVGVPLTVSALRYSMELDEAKSGTLEAVSAELARIEELEHADFDTKVQELLQNPELPGGCEVASMLSLLRAMGYDAPTRTFVDDFLMSIKGEQDMVNVYSGSPYSRGAAFPPVMARAGNGYLRSEGSEWRFAEPDDPSFDVLLEYVEKGRPVLVWTTMGMAAPSLTDIEVEGYRWYTNEHCVLLYGVEGDACKVMDPLAGMVERDRKAFEEIYEACGEHALYIDRTDIADIDAEDEMAMRALAADSSSSASSSSRTRAKAADAR